LLLNQQAKGNLAEAFRALFHVLRYQGATNLSDEDIGLPKVMFTRLSPNLLQVLLLWILQAKSDSVTIQDHRADIIRFVMFWGLCVLNENKASARCFEEIKKAPTAVTMKALYELLVEDSEIAVHLASPREMRACRVRAKGSPCWLSHAERFDPKGAEPVEPVKLARRWWESGEASLLWLQRAYLERSFPDFDPASGRDDDTPYDLDHMIPQSDWYHWKSFSNRLREAGLEGRDLDHMHTNRWVAGDALGNKWLVNFSTNRGWGKAPFGEKTEKLVDEVDRQSESELSYEDLAFDPAAAQVWLRASHPDGKWSKDRLISFQQAVEARTGWLYERFYTDLHFQEFESDCPASFSPSADKSPCALAPDDEHELEAAE
jgi:hypothetical protein